MDKGLGSVTWWGFSPALDVTEYFKMASFGNHKKDKHVESQSESSNLTILLVGGGDIRHILKTVSKIKASKNATVHFYLLENNLEIYARILMLFSLALELPENFGLQEKTELMAEIFGNSLIRTQTASYIQSASNKFVRMVTDLDALQESMPVFDLENLKYKERDMLEGIFKLWRKPDTKIFDVEQCWDLRLRQYLGTRYDAAKGAFDWDYSMKLCDRGAEIIGSRYYQRWRKTGVAFQLREGTYEVPNKTLASGMIFNVNGDRQGRRGYWGDIVVSPFVAFGVECCDETFFKRSNKEYVSNSEEVTQHNLTSLLHELQTGESYVPHNHADGDDPGETSMTTITEEDESSTDVESLTAGGDNSAKAGDNYNYMPCGNVKISFLPLNSLPDITNKDKYRKLFDIVYFSNSMVHHLVPPIADIFADESILILETAKFITELSREQYIQFTNKIDSMAKGVGCQTLIDCNPEKDCFSFYQHTRKAE